MFVFEESKPVFDLYEQRRHIDERTMAELGPAGFARRDEFLLPVGPEAGRVLHSLILAKKPKLIVEFGTSYGYSTLFLADAAKAVNANVITLELADYKQAFASKMIADAGLSDFVSFELGDAVELAQKIDQPVDFCLIDIWKELYVACFDAIYPKLSDEAMIAADNMISPEMARPEVRKFRDAVKQKADMQSTLLPIGAGIELSVKWPQNSDKL